MAGQLSCQEGKCPVSEDVDLEGFGARVREARMRLRREDGRRWSQEDLADRVGVARTTVSEWERGRGPRDPKDIARLASVLGVGAEWLLHGSQAAVLWVVPEARTPAGAEPAELSLRARAWLYDFLADLARAGVASEVLHAVERVLIAPENQVIYGADRRQRGDDASRFRAMLLHAEGIWQRLIHPEWRDYRDGPPPPRPPVIERGWEAVGLREAPPLPPTLELQPPPSEKRKAAEEAARRESKKGA